MRALKVGFFRRFERRPRGIADRRYYGTSIFSVARQNDHLHSFVRNAAALSRRILGALAGHSLSAGRLIERADMTTSNPVSRNNATLRILHWAMAAIIFTAVALGVVVAFLPRGVSPRGELLAVLKSLGMTALAFVFLRVAWHVWVKRDEVLRAHVAGANRQR